MVFLNLDGAPIGACRMSTLINWITPDVVAMPVIVHHLLGHLPEQVTELVLAIGSIRCIFWLHDFFSICPDCLLQRNNLKFCGGPPASSNACMLCVYGKEPIHHVKRMRQFFETLEVDVASPSSFVAELWQEKSRLPFARLTVLPHIVIQQSPWTEPEPVVDGPVTVAFLGSVADHKGWPVFVSLMQEYGDDSRFRYVVLSAKRPQLGEAHWREVLFSTKSPDAMTHSIKAEKVDLVLHWPTWPEPFR